MTQADASNTTDSEQTEPLVELERNGVNYTILGTAHVSKASAEAVVRILQERDFDAVAVELCESRYHAMQNPDAWQDLDLFQIIKDGKAGLVAANLALGAYQRRIADQFGIEPGAEMKAAIKSADDLGVQLLLIDRDVGITLKRVYRSVGFFQRLAIMSGLVASIVTSEEIEEEEIERLKQGDILDSTFSEFAERSEQMYHALIAERDEFMSASLRTETAELGVKNVLVVIGAGHLGGLAKHLNTDNGEPSETKQRLNTLPPSKKWPKYIPWIIVALVVAGFAKGFSSSTDLGWDLIVSWVVINGSLSALGALIAGAHPLTVVTAFVAAPITSLNPTVGAGMVTAAAELWLRRPRILDFEKLKNDVQRFSGWWKNRVARTLLVFFFSTLGSAIGTYVAGFKIYDQLFP